jgi:hypothetical protein
MGGLLRAFEFVSGIELANSSMPVGIEVGLQVVAEETYCGESM